MLTFDALVDLASALRGAGYDVGVAECHAATHLLLELEARGALPANDAQLRSILGPIFCASPREQRAFAADFARWLAHRQEATPAGPAPADADSGSAEQAASSGTDTPPDDATRAQALRARKLRLWGALALAIVVASLLAIRPWEPSSVLPAKPDASRAASQPASGASAPPAPRQVSQILPAIANERDIRLPPLPHRPTQAVAAALPIVLGGAILLLLARRRRLTMRAAERAEQPVPQRVSAGGAAFQLFDRATLRRIAQEFRRHRPHATTDIDAAASVLATVTKGGLFEPVYLTRKALPEYLVLVDQASARDHQARWADELVGQLTQDGVAMERFYFDRDPRRCQTSFQRPSRIRTIELAAQYHDHVLMIFGDGDGFFDPLSGELSAWVEGFSVWTRRVLVTPRPLSRWGAREGALRSQGFVIAPADLAGLQLVASMAEVLRSPDAVERSFPALLRGGESSWLERVAPPQGDQAALASQLKWFLGPRGYQWLCACALYPQLQWEITLHLGQRLMKDDASVRNGLSSMTQLPWFRMGALPPWLRSRLASSLSPNDEAATRAAYRELFDGMPGAEAFMLEVARDQAAPGSWLAARRQAWQKRRGQAGMAATARKTHPASPLRDYAFVSFMQGENPASLEMEVPDSWREALELGAWPSDRQIAAVSLPAMLLAVAGWWTAGTLLTRAPTIDLIDLSRPGTVGVVVESREVTEFESTGLRQLVPGSPAATRLRDFLRSGAARVDKVRMSSDGRTVATASADGTVRVRLPDDSSPIMSFVLQKSPDLAIELSSSGRLLGAASIAGDLRFLRPPFVSDLPGDALPGSDAIDVMALDDVLTVLSRRGTDGNIEVYATGQYKFELVGQIASHVHVTALAIAQGANPKLWIGDSQGKVWSSNLVAPPGSTPISPSGDRVLQLAQAQNGLLATLTPVAIQVWDPATGENIELRTAQSHEAFTRIQFSSDGTRLAAATADGVLAVWDLTLPKNQLRPGLDLAQSILDFGPVPLGSEVSLHAGHFKNPTDQTQAIVARPTVPGASSFRIDAAACGAGGVAPHSECDVAIVFAPTAPRAFADGFELGYENYAGIIALRGIGVSQPLDAPKVGLSIVPTAIEPGQEARLCWLASGAESISISPDIGSLRLVPTCRIVKPSSTTTYVLEAHGKDGAVAKASAQLRVANGSARILKFVASPAQLNEGDQVQLCFAVVNEDRILIRELGPSDAWISRSSPPRPTLPGTTWEQCLTTVAHAATTGYTLTAEADKAASAEQTLKVDVRPKASSTIWCCATPRSKQDNYPTRPEVQASAPNTSSVTEMSNDLCIKLGGTPFADRSAALLKCAAEQRNDTVQVLGWTLPSAGVVVAANQVTEVTATVAYTLESVDRADLVLSIAQTADQSGGCRFTSADLVASGRVAVRKGSGTAKISIKWAPSTSRSPDGTTGYLAPLPSLLRPDTSEQLRTGTDPKLCVPYTVRYTTCIDGYVWREAFDGDRVCVTPAARLQAAEDNRQASERISPRSGAEDIVICLPGYVWRQAGTEDHVCVTPTIRSRTAEDNEMGPSRIAVPRTGASKN